MSFTIFSGNTNKKLALNIANILKIKLANVEVSKFSDGEIKVSVNQNVRGDDAFIIQSFFPNPNRSLMELLILSDALHRSSVNSITAIIPYFAYARQDRRTQSQRVPISAKVVANMITASHINRILTVDLHSEQIQGFFDIPVDNIYASAILAKNIKKKNYQHMTFVSPDIGGIRRARATAKILGADLAIIDKRRPKDNLSEVMNIIGEVKGRTCIIIDDMIDTAGTLMNAAKALKKNGAIKVYAYATHGVLSGNAIININQDSIDEVVLLDTIDCEDKMLKSTKIRQISLAPTLAECINRLSTKKSINEFFGSY